MRFWLPALIAIAVVPATAHHPASQYYDGSKPVTITGVVAELRVVNPHVVLIVEGTAPDGSVGRWAFEGVPPTALRRREKDFEQRLKVGTRLTIVGWAAKDPAARAFSGGEITFADGSTMVIGGKPVEGNGWQCGPGPCNGYTYPDVRPQ
jgi:hypothetical protein